MSKSSWLLLVAAFFVTVFLTAFFTAIYVNNQVTLFERNKQYCVVYGYVTDKLLNQPVENVTIMFFNGDPEEIAYTNSTYWTRTDRNGFYIEIMPLVHGYDYPQVEAVKNGYYAIPIYIGNHRPTAIMMYGYIETARYQFALYHADFQMIQLGNFSTPDADLNLTRTYVTMNSTIFSKLDYSYQFWDWVKLDPDWMLPLVMIEIVGGHGNNTQVIVKGMIPNRVDVTFFNGTHIATSSYYPRLQYWTDPEIVKGKK